MESHLKDKLSGFKQVLSHYKQYQIVPIHSVAVELKQLYVEIGHQPTGNCSSCYEKIFLTLWDHIVEEGI